MSQGVLCGFGALAGLAMGQTLVGSLFAASGLCFLLGGAGTSERLVVPAGTAILSAALVSITVSQGAEPALAIVLGAPALCIAAMAYARDVHTKHRTGSTPSSARAS